MAPKKPDPAKEKEEQAKESVWALHLKGFSTRYIQKKLKISTHVQVWRMIQVKQKEVSKAEEKLLSELRGELLKNIQRLDQLAAAAWEGHERSMGKSTKTVHATKSVQLDAEQDEDSWGPKKIKIPAEEVKESKTVSTLIGDPRWAQIILQTIVERARHLKMYEKKEDDDDEKNTEAVRFEQNLYLPGLGAISPELLKQLAEGQDFWHLLEGLLQNQDPHVWKGTNEPPP